jgi:hypothetical protein
VTSAADAVVTQASHPDIIADLTPTRNVTFTVRCGAETWQDPVSTYSRRRQYWNHQFVVDHEGFHRTDWMRVYRPHLKAGEQRVWAHSVPVSAGQTAADAVTSERVTLNRIMTDTYTPACQEYTPEKETRAYDAGAPAYQQLVDAIRARAAAAWPAPAQPGQPGGQAPAPGQPAQPPAQPAPPPAQPAPAQPAPTP